MLSQVAISIPDPREKEPFQHLANQPFLLIEGSCRLEGEVEISGAKNAALPLLFATLLAKGEHLLSRVPNVLDIKTTLELLETLGVKVSFEENQVTIHTGRITSTRAPQAIVSRMRASILALGPLVARYGEAEVALPGGCAIGKRPVGLHLEGLRKLGANIYVKEGTIFAKAKRLKGTTISFPAPTVTGTENLLMAAVLAEGTTILENAAKEPEIGDLACALIRMGAKIRGVGKARLMIEGVSELSPLVDYEVLPDRIEAGTYTLAALATQGKVLVRNCNAKHLEVPIHLLCQGGMKIASQNQGKDLLVEGAELIHPLEVETAPYPGFPTDLQAQLTALLTRAQGISAVKETIFENRFSYVPEMKKLGAAIEVTDNIAKINGPASALTGGAVCASDLRAGASLVILALMAQGKSRIFGLEHIDRGYEAIETKLAKLGAKIQRKALDS